MYGNPRYLGIKELFVILLSLLWQRLKDWIHPAAGTPESFLAQSSFLPDYVELCGVEATVHETGALVGTKRILKTAGHAWWFADPTVKRLRDALVSTPVTMNVPTQDEVFSTFKCQAVRFELTPMFNADYVARHGVSGCISAMDVDISNGQEYAHLMFEEDESNSLHRMAQLAIERADTWLHTAQFVGVFHVWYDEQRDIDGGVDSIKVSAEFVREFEIENVLKSLTAVI